MTLIPAFCASWIWGMMALVSLGTMMMALTPAAIESSMSVTWLALSPSYLPVKVSSFTPSAFALTIPSCFSSTKTGFSLVLVISENVSCLVSAAEAEAAAPASNAPTATAASAKEILIHSSLLLLFLVRRLLRQAYLAAHLAELPAHPAVPRPLSNGRKLHSIKH